jgi:uncharacterized Zn-binding protein involved in type VI secretion
MRKDIRDGDSTTANGVVICPGRSDRLDGREIAYEGDHVHCRTCGSTGYILCVGERPRETGDGGKPSALSGDLCICKCDPPPKLLSSQNRSGSR